jgi:hypothetical protein
MGKLPNYLICIALVCLSLQFSASSCSTQKVPLKAAIVDQLGTDYPNAQFIDNITNTLEDKGFTVSIIQGDEITVNFYRQLPTYGFRLIIIRVHSTAILEEGPSEGKTFLFTNEIYDKSKYIGYQLADMVRSGTVADDSPRYFSVSADLIAADSEGFYDQSFIIMMGCFSLYSPDMAEAFISRGALMYTGWDRSVKLDFVDDFTITLIENLCQEDITIEKALYRTVIEKKGFDPTYHAVFSYYPSEHGQYTLLGDAT